MDSEERYKITESIRDAIIILDSSPLRQDLMAATNLVQMSNRVPIAHLAIERGLKALIAQGGGTPKTVHALRPPFNALKKIDPPATTSLQKAFRDAVQFFGLDITKMGFTHFRSIEDYFSKVAGEKAFQAYRYWPIEEGSLGSKYFPYVSLLIHREILCALEYLLESFGFQTVTERVEREVEQAMFDNTNMVYITGDIEAEESAHWYIDWLFNEHASPISALKEAVEKGFEVRGGDALIEKVLTQAYRNLTASTDPAIRYLIRTLSYLPKGSLPTVAGAKSKMNWWNDNHFAGAVETPSGSTLGILRKAPDGSWEITPSESGLVRVSAIARTREDAQNYLVDRLTSTVSVSVDGHEKQCRLLFRNGHLPLTAMAFSGEIADIDLTQVPIHNFEFWDENHGLQEGNNVVFKFAPESNAGVHRRLKGSVSSVKAHKVLVAGKVDFVFNQP